MQSWLKSLKKLWRKVEGMTERLATFGRKGMVSTAHPAATAVAAHILQQNGTAFDAAITAAAALNVTEPMMSGIGGYGTILLYDAASQQVRFLDSSGRIPQAVDSDAFRAPYPQLRSQSAQCQGRFYAW